MLRTFLNASPLVAGKHLLDYHFYFLTVVCYRKKKRNFLDITHHGIILMVYMLFLIFIYFTWISRGRVTHTCDTIGQSQVLGFTAGMHIDIALVSLC